MEEMQVFDPFAWGAAGIHLLVLLSVTALLAGLAARRRGRAWNQLRDQLQQTVPGGAAFAALPRGDFLVYGPGRSAGRTSTGAFGPVSRVALVKDRDGQTGLVVTAGGADICLTGMGPMARIWAQAQRDGVEPSIVFRSDEGERMKSLVGRLGAKERELLTQWLTEREVLTDILDGVEYVGRVSAGVPRPARLLVTNLRVGLLATTVMHSTTHLELISYLLPLARRVTLRRTASLRKPRYRLELELAPEHQGQEAPTLLLTEDHTGIFLPLVLFRRPVKLVETPARALALVRSTLATGIGPAILTTGLGIVVAAFLSEGLSRGHWYYRYTLPILLAAAATPFLLRAGSLALDLQERSRDRRLQATLSRA